MSINNTLRYLGLKPHPSNWKHFWAGLVISFFAFIFAYFQLEYILWSSIWIGIGSASFVGLLKEIWDGGLNQKITGSHYKPNFDILDLIMTVLGGIGGVILGWIIYLLL